MEKVEELPGSETPRLPIAKATPPRRRLQAEQGNQSPFHAFHLFTLFTFLQRRPEQGNPKPILFPAGGWLDLDAKRTSRTLCSPPPLCLLNSGSGPEHGRDGPEAEMRPPELRELTFGNGL